MFTFINPLPTILSGRLSNPLGTSSITAHPLSPPTLRTRSRRATHPTCKAAAPNVNDDNDPDAQVYGMRLPELSEEDRAFLDKAESDEDFMRRMQRLAHKMDQDRKREGEHEGRQSAEGYLDSLGEARREGRAPFPVAGSKSAAKDAVAKSVGRPPAQERVDAPPKDAGTPRSIEDIEAEMDKLESKLSDAFEVSSRLEENVASPKITEPVEKAASLSPDAFARTQEQTEKESGGEETTLAATVAAEAAAAAGARGRPGGGDSGVVDKQINFLESYLTKLEEEARVEGDAEKLKEDSNDAADDGQLIPPTPDVTAVMDALNRKVKQNSAFDKHSGGEDVDKSGESRVTGLEDTPGGMSAEEKMAAFRAIQQQAMAAKQGGNEFADPYNVELPLHKDGSGNVDLSQGEMPTEDAADYDSFGEETNKKLLVEEIEMEMKSYTKESKRLLQNHDSRMNLLLTRLMAMLYEEEASDE